MLTASVVLMNNIQCHVIELFLKVLNNVLNNLSDRGLQVQLRCNT